MAASTLGLVVVGHGGRGQTLELPSRGRGRVWSGAATGRLSLRASGLWSSVTISGTHPVAPPVGTPRPGLLENRDVVWQGPSSQSRRPRGPKGRAGPGRPVGTGGFSSPKPLAEAQCPRLGIRQQPVAFIVIRSVGRRTSAPSPRRRILPLWPVKWLRRRRHRHRPWGIASAGLVAAAGSLQPPQQPESTDADLQAHLVSVWACTAEQCSSTLQRRRAPYPCADAGEGRTSAPLWAAWPRPIGSLDHRPHGDVGGKEGKPPDIGADREFSRPRYG